MRHWGWFGFVFTSFSFAQITTTGTPLNHLYIDGFAVYPQNSSVNKTQFTVLGQWRANGTDLYDLFSSIQVPLHSWDFNLRGEYSGSADWNQKRISAAVHIPLQKNLKVGTRLGITAFSKFNHTWGQILLKGVGSKTQWSIINAFSQLHGWEPLISVGNNKDGIQWQLILNKEFGQWSAYGRASYPLNSSWNVNGFIGTGIWGSGMGITKTSRISVWRFNLVYLGDAGMFRPVVKWTYNYEKRISDRMLRMPGEMPDESMGYREPLEVGRKYRTSHNSNKRHQ